MRYTIPLVLFCFSTFSALAQQPDRWRGLVIDETTADQAIAVLGKPKNDKRSVPGGSLVVAWEAKNRPADGRMLHYENIEGFNDVKLFFDKDSVLVTIFLEPKKLTPQELIASYNTINFRTANEVLSPADLDNPSATPDRPDIFAAVYVIVGATPKVIVSAGIGNATGNVRATMMDQLFGDRNKGSRQAGRTYPGKVMVVSLSSRRNMKAAGSDLLK